MFKMSPVCHSTLPTTTMNTATYFLDCCSLNVIDGMFNLNSQILHGTSSSPYPSLVELLVVVVVVYQIQPSNVELQ
ncbi:hypothetical protein C0J52_25736 [Blattella germanica]|nr:hypothetical protein C0J52_25736 [Blattella germanica]